ncbi:NnrS family protein [uncultured Jannaschia sp.]|uniref:NnrS family protein n=1 Tax=uncultured Jannaschia sp. TaxID=293347 RepID=UPI0026216207|nr:NnrS family protein [uncultured Jannaschia sp.]
MSSTAEQMRAWRGPALLTYGFRPFFFGAGIWAVIAMVIWVPMLSGLAVLPTAFDPVSWHAHEFLFGYLGAVVAGFLLTAVPNWTGRLPIVGWPLGGLFALWIIGRIAVALSAGLPAIAVAMADLAFPVVLAAAVAREIVVGRNGRNLIVLTMLGMLILGNAVFHWEGARGDFAAQGTGLRLGLAAGIMMIAVIGGRVVPSFTRNWLVKRQSPVLPTPPMQRFDKLALLLLALALLLWVMAPVAVVTGLGMLLTGAVHLWRLARWTGYRTRAEPLVLVLHGGYAFVPLGALAIGTAILWPGMLGLATAQHVWMAGALGLMTLAVMTRATLGHTGQALSAGTGTVLIYAMLIVAVLARVLAGPMPALAPALHAVSGVAWIAAFGGFSALYGPLLLRIRPAR